MKQFLTNILIWEAITWTRELQEAEALIKTFSKLEVYETHATEIRVVAYQAFATTVTFVENDMLLFSPCHNHYLYMREKFNGHEMNQILVDVGVAVNIMPLKTFKTLYLMPHLQKLKAVKISGFNHNTEDVLNRVDVDMVLHDFASKATFYIIDPTLHIRYCWVAPRKLGHSHYTISMDQVYQR